MGAVSATGTIGKHTVWIVARFAKANTPRKILLKLALIIIVASIVVAPAFVLRHFALTTDLTNDTAFIHLTAPIANQGVAWSGLSDAAPALIVFLQLLPVIVGILALFWLRKWWTIMPVLFFVIGGLCNFADRFVDDVFPVWSPNYPGGATFTNSVVDYLQFTGRSEVFNLPDAFIIVGAGLTVVAIIVSMLLGAFKKTPVAVVT